MKKGVFNMAEKIKVGLWGLGRAGGGMHVREINANSDVLEIGAVCDIDAARAEEFGKKFNVGNMLPSLIVAIIYSLIGFYL